jgi:hypothetical protein
MPVAPFAVAGRGSEPVATVVMHDEYMKRAILTARIDDVLKRKLETTAKRERRSLSAQVVTILEKAVREEPVVAEGAPGRLLGLYEGTRVPTDEDFAEVRRMLWGSLGRRKTRRRA